MKWSRTRFTQPNPLELMIGCMRPKCPENARWSFSIATPEKQNAYGVAYAVQVVYFCHGCADSFETWLAVDPEARA